MDKTSEMTAHPDAAPKGIVTTHLFPPIQARECDWCAHFDSYEPGDIIGYGRTEADAIANLKEQTE